MTTISSSSSSSLSDGSYSSSPDYVAKKKLQIDLYPGDTIIAERSPYLFPGVWSNSLTIYGIDATNRNVCVNVAIPLLMSANIKLVSTTRTNVNDNLFNRIYSLSECILHSGSIDGLNSQQRSLKRTQQWRL
jgi:hypothetical protein